MLHHRQIAGLPVGKHSDGGGLRYISKGDGSGRWEVRYSVGGKRRDAGLGTYPNISLKQAREAAQEARFKARKGIDITKRGNATTGRASASEGMTVADALPLYLKAHENNISTNTLRAAYERMAWRHVGEKLGHIAFADLAIDDLITAYSEMWHTRYKTLKNILMIVRGVIQWASRRGLPVNRMVVTDFQAEMGRTRYVGGSNAVIEWQQAPDIYQTIDTDTDVAIAAKIHLIACTRIKPVTTARWQDILTDDAKIADVWTIPRNHMKGVKIEGEEDLPLDKQRPPHCVPLTAELKGLFQMLLDRRETSEQWVFLRFHKGEARAMHQNLVWKLMNGLGANTHCARSCFATWADETGAVERKVTDSVLDHTTLKGSRARYNFARLVDQKRQAQTQWESFLTGGQIICLKTARTGNG